MALNVHTLANVQPPKGTISQLESYLAKFFWSGNEVGGKHHWVAWKNLCFPCRKEGTNFKKMDEICKAFTIKHWWKFKTTNCLWSRLLRAKYCGTTRPINTTWRPGVSRHWKAMSELRLKIEDNIWWKIGKGEINFWFDNWLSIVPLYMVLEDINVYQNIKCIEVLRHG